MGIDLSPNVKQCNFDCLYCELKGAKTVEKAVNTPTCKEVLDALQEALQKHKNIDVITLTANGEPTLYPHLDELVDGIVRIKKEVKLLILSNGSTINNSSVQKILSKIDIVKLSLDCATQQCFKKLDRPHSGIELEHIIEGMKHFKKMYAGELVLEILVVESINDNEEEFEALNRVLQEIQPSRIDIGTIDRPPAYKIKGVSTQRLIELSHLLGGLHVNIAYQKHYIGEKRSFSENEILELLDRRPQSFEDINFCFDDKSHANLEKLLTQKRLHVKSVAGVNFYTTH